jgi:methylase of polypeptide subunit release factors
MEIGFGQAKAVEELFLSSEFRGIEIEKDYRGIERAVILHK